MLHFREITVSGSVRKLVSCEKCRGEFAYLVKRESTTTTFPGLERPAVETCRKRLAVQLEKGVEVVSCPGCGWIQAGMVAELRRRFLGPLRTVGKFFLFSGAGLGIFLVVIGILYPHNPRDPGSNNVDCFGFASAWGVASVVGGLLIVLRMALGGLRYLGGGFFAKKARGTKFLAAGARKAA